MGIRGCSPLERRRIRPLRYMLQCESQWFFVHCTINSHYREDAAGAPRDNRFPQHLFTFAQQW